MIYNFKVSNLVLSCTNGRKVITSDSVNYHTATFALDSGWDNMTTILAIFTNSKDNSLSAEQLLDVNNSCRIPASPISKDGNLLVKLVGENTSLNQHIETEMQGNLTISPSTIGDGGEDKTFTPNIITQLEDLIDDKGDNLTYENNILSLKSGDDVLSTVEISGGGSGEYTLPTMSTSVKGGAKVGNNLLMTEEALGLNPDLQDIERIHLKDMEITPPANLQVGDLWREDGHAYYKVSDECILDLGRELFQKVRNDTGSTILNGSIVYENGSIGASENIRARLFLSDGSIDWLKVIGIATEDIPNGTDGNITVFGAVGGLNTSSIPVGARVYASDTISGGFTGTKANYSIVVGSVLRSHATTGIIFIRGTHLELENATSTKDGLLSKENFIKLDGLSNYTLPTASGTIKGGVKVGNNLSIDGDGILSANTQTPNIMTSSVNGIGKPDGINLAVDANGTFDFSASIKSKLPNWDLAYTNNHTHANKSTLDLVSGINTGDETNSTILSKIGYTPENLTNKNQALGYCGLDSGGKVPASALPTTLLQYIGVWNASTNTPALTSPDLTKVSNVYTVSMAGTQFGISFKVGDWLIYNAMGVPEKSDNSDDVTSVNGKTGVVVLTTADIADSLDKRYVTDAQKTVISNTSGTNSGNETISTIGTLVNGATAKATPIDDDMIPLMDSTSSNIIRKLSWVNIKSTLKAYFDTLYTVISSGSLIADATTLSIELSKYPTIKKTATLTTCTSLTITLPSGANWYDEFVLYFTTSTTSPIVTLPSGVVWVGGTPTFSANKTYVISVQNGIGVVANV